MVNMNKLNVLIFSGRLESRPRKRKYRSLTLNLVGLGGSAPCIEFWTKHFFNHLLLLSPKNGNRMRFDDYWVAKDSNYMR